MRKKKPKPKTKHQNNKTNFNLISERKNSERFVFPAINHQILLQSKLNSYRN